LSFFLCFVRPRSNTLHIVPIIHRTNWPDHKALPLPARGLTWDDCPPILFDEIFTAAPKDAISLLRSLLVLDPNKRFSASQCLSHPYFTNDPAPTPKERLVLSSPTNN
jgi:serine/threonine protein kinase